MGRGCRATRNEGPARALAGKRRTAAAALRGRPGPEEPARSGWASPRICRRHQARVRRTGCKPSGASDFGDPRHVGQFQPVVIVNCRTAWVRRLHILLWRKTRTGHSRPRATACANGEFAELN